MSISFARSEFRVEIFPSRFTDFTRSREPAKTPTFRRYRRHLHFTPAISKTIGAIYRPRYHRDRHPAYVRVCLRSFGVSRSNYNFRLSLATRETDRARARRKNRLDAGAGGTLTHTSLPRSEWTGRAGEGRGRRRAKGADARPHVATFMHLRAHAGRASFSLSRSSRFENRGAETRSAVLTAPAIARSLALPDALRLKLNRGSLLPRGPPPRRPPLTNRRRAAPLPPSRALPSPASCVVASMRVRCRAPLVNKAYIPAGD